MPCIHLAHMVNHLLAMWYMLSTTLRLHYNWMSQHNGMDQWSDLTGDEMGKKQLQECSFCMVASLNFFTQIDCGTNMKHVTMV